MGPFDFHFNIPAKPQLGKIAVERSSTGRELLVLKIPIKFFTNVHTNKEPIGYDIGHHPQIYGEIEFGLHVSINLEEQWHWNKYHLKLGRKKQAQVTKFVCKGMNRCDDVQNFLQNEFPKKVLYNIYEEGSVWDRNPIEDYWSPNSARMFMGVLHYINDFSEKLKETMHVEINSERQIVWAFFNCHGDSVRDAMSKEVR